MAKRIDANARGQWTSTGRNQRCKI